MAVLSDRVVLITGGSSGIGRATALEFAREGARVVIAARGAERGERVAGEIEALGAEALFVATDVSRAAEVERLVAATVERFGRLDFGFNNAASVEGEFAPTAEVAEEDFDRWVAVNLKGVWLCMKHEIRQMLAQEPAGGAIVNTSSVNGLGGVAQASVYAASKAGVLGLTKSAALEYASRGIRVNALVAGAFETPMRRMAVERASGGDPERMAELETRFRQLIPEGRIADPQEAARVVVWLCSGAASYVTGHSMIVDGGLSALFR